MAGKVNLDALIERQDFDPTNSAKVGEYDKIFAHDLLYGRPLYSMLRKPDFQRATYVWTPQQVRDLVLAFTEEDLIPALILWRSESNHVFVIDGAHRLSSLIAWVNNDYGIGEISRPFFEGDMSEHERTAKKTRELVETDIGPYAEIESAFGKPGASERYKQIAGGLRQFNLRVQWITGDGKKAERSFFKINRQGVPLTPTELTLLHSRRCPNSLAARAIIQRAAGHPHWKHFTPENTEQTEAIAQELYSSLLRPPLTATTISTTETPIAGRPTAATALSLILDAVNISNSVASMDIQSKEEAEKLIPADIDGSQTVAYLRKTKKILYRIFNRTSRDDMSSLNLHPFVYFYSENGKHLPSSFLAVVEFMYQLERNNGFVRFALVRDRFEEFLINNKDLLNQISRENRGQLKAVHAIKEFLSQLFSILRSGKTEDAKIFTELLQSFPYLKRTVQEASPNKIKAAFGPAVKNRVFISQKLLEATRCRICNARIPDYGISYDHSKDKKNSGQGTVENAAPIHHFCNSAKDAILNAKTQAAKNVS